MSQPVDDTDTKWSWIVLIASFASCFVIGGINYNVGIIHTIVLDIYGDGNAITSLVGAFHTSITCIAAPLSSFIIDRYSVRTAIITSGVLYTLGFLGTAFVSSIEMTIVTCGIIAGFGGAVGLTASMVAIGFYFRRYRNIAQGFNLTGTGVGMFVIAPAMQKAKNVYGGSGFFIILACVSIHLILFGVVMRPSKLEIKTQKERRMRVKKDNSSSAFKDLLMTYCKVFTTLSITSLSLSMLMFCFGLYIIFMFLPNYCIIQGVSHMQASFVLSACGAASIFGRIATGFAASYERLPEIVLYSASLFILTLLTFLFSLFSKFYAGQIVYAMVWGLLFGVPFVTITPINIAYVGVSNMAAALGIELCLGGVGAIVGPVAAGFILDHGGTYEHIFIMAGISLLLAGLLGIAAAFFSRRKQGLGRSNNEIDMIVDGSGVTDKMLLDKLPTKGHEIIIKTDSQIT